MSHSRVGHNKNPETSTDSTVLAIVVPCFNEELVIDSTADRLIGLLDKLKSKGKIDQQSYLYFVDDGSQDQTWSKIVDLHGKNGQIKGLKLASNVGHQNALLACFVPYSTQKVGLWNLRSGVHWGLVPCKVFWRYQTPGTFLVFWPLQPFML